MQAKYFAIKNGFRTGIFYGKWAEYESYVKGYSGAKFKSFKSQREAEEYMQGDVPPRATSKKRKRTPDPPSSATAIWATPFIVPAPAPPAPAGNDGPSQTSTSEPTASNSCRPLSGDDQLFIVEFDGASRGNPGKAGCGALVRSSQSGKVLLKAARRLRHGSTNNEAEYEGLILGLEEAHALGAQRIEVRGDSKLVVKQVQGEWALNKEHLRILKQRVETLIVHFRCFAIKHVLREYNGDADQLSNYAVDRGDMRQVLLDGYR